MGIHRHQIIDATDLESMSGIEQQGDLRPLRPDAEAAQRVVHGGLAAVLDEIHIETDALQGRRQRRRVIARIG
ncbi:hypothetical protein CBW56_09670 [Denitratisoma oestradiolicum]|nr:hypothetical protein CBW56_09670 [Denitratisoma oestradiolicum]